MQRSMRWNPMFIWVAAALVLALPGWGQLADTPTGPLAEVGVDEHLGDRLPLDLVFTGEGGEPVRLGELFDGTRPVMLTLNYYECPMLCGLQLNGLLKGFKALNWDLGDRFRVVTVSIDPTETAALAAQKKQNSLRGYGRPGAGEGWRFLVGTQKNIAAIARAVGFRYRWDAATRQYAHPAVATVCSPDGRIMRYLYGIEYPPKQLKAALFEAAEGKIGSTVDRFILACYAYDPASRSYTPVAMRIMRLGGIATIVLLGGVLGLLWLRERAGRRRAGEKGPQDD